MAKRDDKATAPQQQLQQRNQQLRIQLSQFDDDLNDLLQGHRFFHLAMIALAEEEAEPDGWVMGALITHRWLRQRGEEMMDELLTIKQSLPV